MKSGTNPFNRSTSLNQASAMPSSVLSPYPSQAPEKLATGIELTSRYGRSKYDAISGCVQVVAGENIAVPLAEYGMRFHYGRLYSLGSIMLDVTEAESYTMELILRAKVKEKDNDGKDTR